FGQIVNSLVNDVLGPLLGFVKQGNLSILDVQIHEGVTLKFGAFLQAVINFLIVSFCVFLLVKGVNSLRVARLLAGPPPAVELTAQEKLLTEIRDLLKANG